MNLIIICDLDGTVVDSMDRINGITKQYNLDNIGLWTEEHIRAFAKEAYIKNDPLVPGAEKLPILARVSKAKIIFLTGRSSIAREATNIWLKHKLNIFDTVPLLMREDKDLSDPVECKYNMFKNIVLRMYPKSSFIFFDDDEKLLKLYAQHGLALKAPDCWNIIRSQDDELP
jgi:hypothetical protein